MIRFQKKVYRAISEDSKTKLAKAFNTTIIVAIALTLCFVVADTFSIPHPYPAIAKAFEIISVALFTVEYVLRVWVAPIANPGKKPTTARLKYVFSFMAIIDVVSILPFYLPFIFPIDLRVLRVLRVFRLFRILKVNRYTHALNTIGRVFKKKSNQLITSMFAVSLLMVIAAILMYNVENEAQPAVFDNALSGLWWAVATLTTVGYGDIFPITGIGKILSAVIALLGIGLVAVPTGIISAGFVEEIERPEGVPSNELRELKFLLDDKIITQSDFDAKKKQLLNI